MHQEIKKKLTKPQDPEGQKSKMANYSMEETRKAWRDLGDEFISSMEELGVLTPIWKTTSNQDYWPVDDSDLELYEEAYILRNLTK